MFGVDISIDDNVYPITQKIIRSLPILVFGIPAELPAFLCGFRF